MSDRFDPDTKNKWLSVLIALLITLVFAVPYFYYQYFYNPNKQLVEQSIERDVSASANIAIPVSSAWDSLRALFRGDLSGESVYRQEE